MRRSYRNLGEFIAVLERTGQLRRIAAPVSPVLEITEITDRECKRPGGGQALLFERVEGSDFPVLMNAFGSHQRLALALGCRHMDELAARLGDLLNQAPPSSLSEKLAFLPRTLACSRYLPRQVSRRKAPCQEVVLTGDQVDLGRLPVLTCWPQDGGPFVTLPVVFSRSLDDGRRNVGMYRMQVYDRNTTGMHWHIHKDAAHQFHAYRKAGERMPVAVAVGTDPAVTYAATAPLPRGIDELLLAGFIRERGVELVPGVSVDLAVPAEAEFIIEGYIDPHERRREGPFGDHTGYYSLEDDYPVLHVTALTHRRRPVYAATVVGRPPMEDCYLAYATERLFLPLLKTVLPEIRDYWMPWEGVFHNIVVVAIDKEYPAQAQRVMHALWGSGQMSFAKALVLVDDARLLNDGEALMAHLLDTLDLQADLSLATGVLDVLDHSAPQALYGAKIGIDATVRLAGEPPRRRVAEAGRELIGLQERLRALDPGFLRIRTALTYCARPLILVAVDKGSRASRELTDRLAGLGLGGVVVLFDGHIDLEDAGLLLWKVFNNVDPARDILIKEGSLIIDATRKGPADAHARPWPEDIVMSPFIRRRVDGRLVELGLAGG